MKNFSKILAVQILLIAVFAASAFADYPVSGAVRYSDNNEIVTSGVVKAYTTLGILIAQTSINSDGTYLFAGLPQEYIDVIGIPNHEWEDFLPTVYPAETDWQNAVAIYPDRALTGIDIYVERTQGGNYPMALSITGTVTLGGSPIQDAVVYAKIDNDNIGYGVTNEKGEYVIDPLPAGDYVLVVHRIGANSVIKNVILTDRGLEGINFSLQKASPKLNNTSKAKEYKLSQNYPNPFNPVTRIEYILPANGNVKVSVFNSLGQLVKELVNGFQTGGSYTIEFDGSNLSSGTYFYRIETGTFVDTKRMVLVK